MSRITVETMREKGEKSIFILNIYKRIHTGSLQNVFMTKLDDKYFLIFMYYALHYRIILIIIIVLQQF